jgi:hypothetical protein
MTEGFESNLYRALTEYLRNECDVDAERAIGFEEDTFEDGYCETCYFEYEVVKIFYIDRNGSEDVHIESVDLGTLVRELAKY